MELQFERKPCGFLRRTVCETKEQEQTQEVRLSEGMPDIGSILGAWAQPLMRGKEWNSDSVATSGGVMAWVLYAPADGSAPRMVEGWLPVNLKWNMTGAQRMGTIRCQWLLKGVDGRVLSARKLMVRANVSVLCEALEPWEEELFQAVQVPEDVQLLQNTYPARLTVEAGEKAFLLDEELTFSAGETMPERLVSVTVVPELTEQRVLGGKGVFRGNGNFRILYQDGEGNLHSRSHQASFSQLADLDRDHGENAQLSVMMALSSLEPELTEGRLRLKCGMVAQYAVTDAMMMELTEDAYSPSRKVSAQIGQLRLPMELDRRQEAVGFACSMQGSGRVVDVSVMAEQPMLRRTGEICEMACGGQVQVLYYDENGSLQGRSGRWSTAWELPASPDAEIIGTVEDIPDPQISVSDGQLQINGEVKMEAQTLAQKPMAMVTGLEMGEENRPDPGRPSLILRRAGEGSLWDLAKASGSTVTAIRSANGLEEEPLDDRLLLIPVI